MSSSTTKNHKSSTKSTTIVSDTNSLPTTTVTAISSMRNFLKFNNNNNSSFPSNSRQQPTVQSSGRSSGPGRSNSISTTPSQNGPSNEDETNNNNTTNSIKKRSNGYVLIGSSSTSNESSSPLIGRNYPHHRVQKSPSVESSHSSSTTTTTNSSVNPITTKASSPQIISVIDLHPVNNKNNNNNNNNRLLSHHRHSFRDSPSSGCTSPPNYANPQSVLQQQQFLSSPQQHRPDGLQRGSKMVFVRDSTSSLADQGDQGSQSPQKLYDNVPTIVESPESPQSPISPKFDRKNFLRNSMAASTSSTINNHQSQGPRTSSQTELIQQQYGQILDTSTSSKSLKLISSPNQNNNSDSGSNSGSLRLRRQFRTNNANNRRLIQDGTADVDSGGDSDSQLSKRQSQQNSIHSFQWIEIMEPKSRTKMFANLSTGECRWAEPKGVAILRQSNPNLTQWWELYDQKTHRFYYYSVKDSKTIWQKPNSPEAIVVPLAKLQIIKQNNSSSNTQLVNDNSPSSSPPSSTGGQITSSPGSPPSFSTSVGATPGCLRCLRLSHQRPQMVDSSTQTLQSPPIMQKPSMISRWTQTTTQTPVNVRLLQQGQTRLDNQRRTVPLPLPSLRHYLLSEARFAASRGQQQDRIYDPISKEDQQDEGIYDPVAQDYHLIRQNDRTQFNSQNIEDNEDEIVMVNDDYYDQYYEEYDFEDDDDDYEDESDDSECDADDEFGGEMSCSDDDDDLDDEDSEEIEDSAVDYESEEDNCNNYNRQFHDRNKHIVQKQTSLANNQQQQTDSPSSSNQQQYLYADYDIVGDDYENYQIKLPMATSTSSSTITKQHSSPKLVHQPQSVTTVGPQETSSNLDGLRMSASFTASDFKRNALGRSSYTPSIQHPKVQQLSSQITTKESNSGAKVLSGVNLSYSNPFNNTGSLRSSTGRICTSTTTPIAERIQLFNQKSATAIANKTSNPSNTITAQSSLKTSGATIQTNSTRSSILRSSPADTSTTEEQVQKFVQQQQLQKSSSSTVAAANLQLQPQPSKSSSMSSMISPTNGGQNLSLVTARTQQQDSGPNKVLTNSVITTNQSKRSSYGASTNRQFPPHVAVTPNNSFDFSTSVDLARSGGSVSSLSMLSPMQSYPPPGPFNSTPSPSGSQQPPPFQFNDAHLVMLSKSSSTNKDTKASIKSTKDSIKTKEGKKPESKSTKKVSKSKSTASNKENKSENGNSIESFARECVSRHRKGGIFSKKKTLKSMLIHTKKPLKKPMISTISDAILVKESVSCFKMIQIFMGDRCASPSASSTSNLNPNDSTTSARISPLPINNDPELLVRLINICVSLVPLRDEVLVQVARQVTQNPSPESERRGLELMCTLFWYFTASNKLAQHLHAFLIGHRNPFTAIVRRKFEQQMHRSRYTHSHLFYRKPHSVDEVARVLRCVRAEHVGIFGENLSDAIYKDDDNKDNLSFIQQTPWPVVLLTEALLEPRHEDREGVFRCVGDMDDVHKLKMKLDTILPGDRYFVEMIGRNGSNVPGRKLTDDHDIHVIASTLKLYFRELRDSIIPTEMYLPALDCAHDQLRACQLLDKLPSLNRSTLIYLIHFLQIFSTPEHVRDTKMDDANLSMVWAPNILRSPLTTTAAIGAGLLGGGGKPNINQLNSANIYEHTRAEMSLVRTFIQHLDTRIVQGK